jgi:peptidoglycan-associated lipoprotein
MLLPRLEMEVPVNSTATSRRILSTAIPAAAALLLCACAGQRQTPATARGALPADSPGVTNIQPATQVPDTPTASIVVISEEVLVACNISGQNAYFAFDSWRITEFDLASLDQVAACFARGPMAGRELQLVGHADSRGTTAYNLTLGQSRADAVATYLIAAGMSSANAIATSRGALDATGRDETGWAHDRRVDVFLAK